MLFGNWGATANEITSAVIGDDLCAEARTVATRCITIAASPAEVFPWIRQMGFGRAGWYSYDWIDNLGRRSAMTVHAEWQDVESGARVPGGPVSFSAAMVEPPNGFVLQLGRSDGRLCFTLAYELRPIGAGTRLVTRMRTRIRVPGGVVLERALLGPGDGFMVRRQLRTLAQRVVAAPPQL